MPFELKSVFISTFCDHFLTVSKSIFIVLKIQKSNSTYKSSSYFLLISIVVQMLLGIYTIMYCIGKVPPVLGSLHQAGAMVLLAAVIYNLNRYKKEY